MAKIPNPWERTMKKKRQERQSEKVRTPKIPKQKRITRKSFPHQIINVQRESQKQRQRQGKRGAEYVSAIYMIFL